jgi:hypothetical protein
MNAVQAARAQAQQGGYLRNTPQQRVVYNGGLIEIVPVNPEVVYVPYYNPWRIYGGWVSPYAGFYVAPPPVGLAIGLGIGFAAVGISLGLFSHYGWGYHNWEPNWRGGVVVYNHNTYISNSTTVINRGNFGAYNRGVFEHAGPGVPANFRPPVTAATASFRRGPTPGALNREAPGFNRPAAGVDRPAPGAVNRPATGAFNRPAPGAVQSSRPAAQAERPSAQAERPQVQRPQNTERPQQSRPSAASPRAEGGNNRPQAQAERPAPRAAAPSRPAAQGHAAEPHGRTEEHEHK